MTGTLAKGGKRNPCPFPVSKGSLGDWIVRLIMEIVHFHPKGVAGTIRNLFQLIDEDQNPLLEC